MDGEPTVVTMQQLVEAVEAAYGSDEPPWWNLYAVHGDRLRAVIMTSGYIGLDGEDYVHTGHALRFTGDAVDLARFTIRSDWLMG